MKNKTYLEPTIKLDLFTSLDVVMASTGSISGTDADFDVGDLLGGSTGGDVI